MHNVFDVASFCERANTYKHKLKDQRILPTGHCVEIPFQEA
jgi:hypothetical protein